MLSTKLILTVECVDNIKRQTPFVAADGDAETQHISESSHNVCSFFNKSVSSKCVDNSKRRHGLYQPTGTTKRTELICTHW